MDSFSLKPERKKGSRKSLIWNILTVLVLLGTCSMMYYFMMIFQNPNSQLNPFPPEPLPTLFQTITPTITIIPLDATWTPTTTVSPIPSRTTAPTWTVNSTTTISPSTTTTFTPTSTPNLAATATAACITFHSKFPGTPCP